MPPLLSHHPKRNSRRQESQHCFFIHEEHRFHGLPPLRRFKILQKERQESLHQLPKPSFQPNVCCLPAKKRVCALQVFTVADDEKENSKALLAPPRQLMIAGKKEGPLQAVSNQQSTDEEEDSKAQLAPRRQSTIAGKKEAFLRGIINQQISPDEEKENSKAQLAPRRQSTIAGKKEALLREIINQQISLDEEKENSKAQLVPRRQSAIAGKKEAPPRTIINQLITPETRCVNDVSVTDMKIGHCSDNSLEEAPERREIAAVKPSLVACAEVVASDEDEDDDIFCSICKVADADASDPIVFCDGCNVMVHASCYGYPLSDGIPSGDWFCCQCMSGDDKRSKRCCLCPSSNGAMKRTTNGLWAHLSCALFVPEVYYARAKEREGIECGSVPSWRWRMQCGLCGQSGSGACIQCTEVNCGATFHVSCALDRGLPIDYRHANVLTRTPAIVIAFCPLHSPRHRTISHAEKRRFKIVPRD